MEELLRQKAKELRIARYLLAIAFLLEFLQCVQTRETSCAAGMAFTAFLFVLCFVYQRILEYRAKRGLYGTCKDEAKEIILFVLKNGVKSMKD